MGHNSHSFVSDGHSALLNGIKGLLSLNPSLRLNETHEVVYRDDPARHQRVAVISGGGSGHEPAHAGFVGHGMLDAAVCGAIFASPNAQQIENGLRAIRSPKGVLIVVKNYTGDKLNFTLASDRFSLATGVPTRLIVVADDVSIGRTRSALVGRRGVAGTILIHKIVGGAAGAGLDIDAIVTIAEQAMVNMGTIGVGLDGCHVPGQASESRLADDEIEIGIGIHNEPGSRRIKPRPSLGALVKDMIANILKDDPERNYLESTPQPDQHDLVLLINNLGGLSALEILAVTNHVITHLKIEYNLKPVRVYSGTLLSALDCPGFSITVLSLPKSQASTPQILNWLDAPTDSFGWPCSVPKNVWEKHMSPDAQLTADTVTESRSTHDIPTVPCNGKLLQDIIKSIHESVLASEPQITENDTILGDGDCGTTLLNGTTSLIEALQKNEVNIESISHSMLKIADLISVSMGGTSGALYAVFMTAFASGIRPAPKSDALNVKTIAVALKQALNSLEQVTAAREGDRTMMDALIPFVDTFVSETENSAGVLSTMDNALSRAKKGCEDTATLKSRFGRSTYVGAEDGQDDLTNIPDPGALGVVAVLSGINSVLPKYFKE